MGVFSRCGAAWRWGLAYLLIAPPIVSEGRAVCAAQDYLALHAQGAGRALIVRDPAAGNLQLAARLEAALQQQGLETVSISLDALADSSWQSSPTLRLLVLPNGRRLPAAAKESIVGFLQSGGKLVAFGAPLYAEPMVKVAGEWVALHALKEQRKHRLQLRPLLPTLDADALSRWEYYSNRADPTHRVALETPTGLDHAPVALRMEFTLDEWSVFLHPFERTPFAEGHTLTSFWVKGSAQAKQMVVEWREADGSRWFAQIPLTPEWRQVVLSPEDFAYRTYSPTGTQRGYAGDRFNPRNASALMVGMEAAERGRHTIWIADLGVAPDPFEGVKTDFAPPVLEMLAPDYKLYPLPVAPPSEGGAELRLGGFGRVALPSDALAPIARWRGLGFTANARAMRLRTLVAAEMDGVERGALIWMVQHAAPPYPHAAWLVFGSADETFWLNHWHLAQHALTHALDQWRHGVWLLEAGSDRFTLYPDETAQLGATILSDSETPPQTEIRFTLLRQEQVAFQHTAIVPLDQRGAATISLPIPPLPMGEYQVQAQLIVAQRVVDEVHHTLTVAARPQLADASPIRVEDGQFVEQGAGGARRWFAFGVNFWPRYVAGMEEADYWRFWLDPSNYDPELVEQDLRLVKALGMNCVSVQYLKVRQALPLRDFLHRCQAHGIRVNLYVDGLHPLYFQPELAQELIQAASLASQPTLFAYDLAWEPIWGDYTQRRAHESAWRVWLVEQYGSLESAERDWGYALPRDEAGRPTVPRDEHLLQDGAWRVMTAAYRRFLDDYGSRLYRRVRRFVKSLDPNRLLGARTGYGGGPFGAEPFTPFDHTTGAKHLDFISPEAWSLAWLAQGDAEQFARAPFITAYARWAGKGKPVLWAEFGLTLRYGAFSLDWYRDTARLNAQASLYEAFYQLVQTSDADGAVAWWFPGGYRIDERSDFGIVNPDGGLRPAAQVAQRWSEILARPPQRPAHTPTATIRIDRDEDARGASALWRKHGDAVAQAVREGKKVVLVSDGIGTTSDNAPALAIGNTPWTPGKPPKFLNGEINAVWVSADGQNWQEVALPILSEEPAVVTLPQSRSVLLRVELGNTGDATWLPPSECGAPQRGVQLRVSVEGGETVVVPIPRRVEPYDDITLEPIALTRPATDAPVRFTVRLVWNGAGFGEQAHCVILLPQKQ